MKKQTPNPGHPERPNSGRSSRRWSSARVVPRTTEARQPSFDEPRKPGNRSHDMALGPENATLPRFVVVAFVFLFFAQNQTCLNNHKTTGWLLMWVFLVSPQNQPQMVGV